MYNLYGGKFGDLHYNFRYIKPLTQQFYFQEPIPKLHWPIHRVIYAYYYSSQPCF